MTFVDPGALGTGYQLPRAQHGPTIGSVLASMDPKTRRYTEKIMALTFTQLAAGAAGHPHFRIQAALRAITKNSRYDSISPSSLRP